MSGFKFIPNTFAKEKFNLKASEYKGSGMTPLLEDVLGKDNYRQFMMAQDPLCGGKSVGDITIITNRGETNPQKMRFKNIGTIHKL